MADLCETNVAARKAASRKSATANRKQAKASAGPDAIHHVARIFMGTLLPRAGTIVSGFLPIGSEIDVRPTLEKLRHNGCEICLPCVVAPDTPLVFRCWQEGDPLVSEDFGTKAPNAQAREVMPDILMVPMLAFDAAGYRLGYGGGFYDRSLEKLRKTKTVLAVGVAFEGQRMTHVPVGVHDQPLDWVITEKGAFQPGGEAP